MDSPRRIVVDSCCRILLVDVHRVKYDMYLVTKMLRFHVREGVGAGRVAEWLEEKGLTATSPEAIEPISPPSGDAIGACSKRHSTPGLLFIGG